VRSVGRKLLERYLLMKPDIRGAFEWAVLMVTSICGYLFSILVIPLSPWLIVVGVIYLPRGS